MSEEMLAALLKLIEAQTQMLIIEGGCLTETVRFNALRQVFINTFIFED